MDDEVIDCSRADEKRDCTYKVDQYGRLHIITEGQIVFDVNGTFLPEFFAQSPGLIF